MAGFYRVPESDPAGGAHLAKWPKVGAPEFPADPAAWMEAEPVTDGRAYIGMLMSDEGGGGVRLKWRLGPNASSLSSPQIESIALFVPPEGADAGEFDITQFISNHRSAVLDPTAGSGTVPLYPRLPLEIVKERILREAWAEPGELREYEARGPFGDFGYSLTFGRIFNTIARATVAQLDTSVAEIEQLAGERGVGYEEGKALVCSYARAAVSISAARAADFFAEHAPEAALMGLAELAHDALWKVQKEMNGGLLKSDGNLKKALKAATTESIAHRKFRVGEPYKEGRPEGSRKSEEAKERDRLEFEEQIEAAITELAKTKDRVTKTDVAEVLGYGTKNTTGGNNSRLPTFTTKVKPLGVNYDEILSRVEQRVNKKLR